MLTECLHVHAEARSAMRPPVASQSNGFSTGIIAGIVVGIIAIAMVASVVVVVLRKRTKEKKIMRSM